MSPNIIRHRRALSPKHIPCVIRPRRLRLARQAQRETSGRGFGWVVAACLAVSGALSLGAVAEDAVTIVRGGVNAVQDTLANAIGLLQDNDTIVFKPDTYPNATGYTITKDNVAFKGADTGTFAGDGYLLPDGSRVQVYNPATVLSVSSGRFFDAAGHVMGSIANLQLESEAAPVGGEGGAIRADGFAGTISNTVFKGFAVTNYNGGALYAAGDFNANIAYSTFIENTAGTGAAIETEGNFNGNIDHSIFINNTATNGHGAAIKIRNTFTGTISNSVFIGNKTNDGLTFGGAIRIIGAFAGVIDNTVFAGNFSNTGGAIAAGNASTFNITNSVFSKNTASSSGGAIMSANINGAITNTIFAGNEATNSSTYGGGAISISGSIGGVGDYLDLSGTMFLQNSTPNGHGGAIFMEFTSTRTIALAALSGDVVFQGNTDRSSQPTALDIDDYSSATLLFSAAAGRTMWFYDSVQAVTSGTNSLTINAEATHTGTVLFDRYESAISGPVTVAHGTLTLQNGASIKATGFDFTVDPGATLTVAYEQERTIYTPVYGNDGVTLLRVDTTTETPAFTTASAIDAATATFDAARLRFLLPSAKPTSALLTVTGSASVEGALIDMVLPAGAATYSKGDRIVLIDAAGGTSGTPATHDDYVNIRGLQGATLQYDF
ncbi:MAG: right-handed parallel beta-helix repeat-containing protein, partial [Azoarcus sp.]|nr:right-handed parallel beta-helix repeat-containing protein [Azoarcus sp.]